MAFINNDDNTEVLMLAYSFNSTTNNNNLLRKAIIKDNAFVLDSGALEHYTSYKD
jgi:hypothetical protein